MKPQRIPFSIFYFFALFFSVLKTIRFPSDWAEAHWMLDYRFGFIKRGLAGEIFGFLFQKTEFAILGLSIAILLALYSVLLFLATKISRFHNLSRFHALLFFVFFFLSQFVIFSAHTIGYLDGVVFLITIFGLVLIRKNHIFISSLLLVFGIFIHEITLFLMLPICLATIVLLQYEKSKNTKLDLKNTGLQIAKFLVLPIVTLIGLILFQGKNETENFKLIFNYLQEIPFIGKESADSVASAYTKSFQFYIKEEIGHFIQRLFISKCTIFYGIPLLMMVYMAFKLFNKMPILILALFVGATVSPLLLHAMAWDTYRIWSFPYMILFLSFWILTGSQSFISQPVMIKKNEFYAYLFGISILALIPSPLFDGEIERLSFCIRILFLSPIVFGLFYLKSKIK